MQHEKWFIGLLGWRRGLRALSTAVALVFAFAAAGAAASSYTPPAASITIVDRTAGTTDFNTYPGNSTSTDADISNTQAGGGGAWKKTNLGMTSGYAIAGLSGANQRICTYTPNATAPWPGTDIFYYRVYINNVESLGAPVNVTFKSSQTLTFPAIANHIYGDAPITLNATSAHALTATGGQTTPTQPSITYAVTSGPATINGNVLTITGVGSITVTASQAGDTNYAAAPDVSRTFSVSKAVLTVTADPASRAYGVANPTFTATYSGFVNGETLATSDVTGSPALTTTATTSSPVGSYTIAAAVGSLSSNDYSFTMANGMLTVSKADPTITWGNPAAITYGTALSGTQLNATASVPGSFAYSPVSGTVLGGGSQTLSTTFTPTDTTNYNTATASVTLTVNKADPTITWADPAAIAYGTALSGTQLNATASAPGSFAYSPAAGTVLNAGSQTLSTTFTPTNTTNYNTISKSVTLTVNQVTPTITWSNPAAITYGTALSGTQLNATASVPGSFAYSPTSGVVLGAGSQTLSTTFTPTDTTNYTTATKSVSLTVSKANPTIGWSNPAAIVYGTALGAAQLNATSSVPGSFAYGPSFGTVLAAGSQTLSTTFTPTDTADYNAVGASVMLTVSKATPAITWSNPAAITYGTALSGTQLNASSPVAGSFAYSPAAGTVLGAGSQTLSTTFTPTDASNYTNAAASVTLTVNQATPVLTWAAPAAIIYGTALSAAQLSASASVPGSFVYSPAAGTVLGAGSQTLSTTFTPTDSVNYTTCTQSVSLTVGQASLTITADDQTKVYGSANPSLTASYAGFVNGESAGDLGGSLALGTAATAGSPVGTYAVTASGLTSANYAIAFVDGTLTVTAATLTVIADDQSKAYGSANPTLTASFTGFVNGDTAAVLSGAPALGTGATVSSGVGGYAINIGPGNLSASDYSFAFVPGTLSVTKAILTVTVDDATRAYGAADPAFTYALSGFVNGESLATSGVSGAPAMSTSTISSSPAGTYPIAGAIGSLTATNYDFAFASGTLTVTPVPLQIAANDATMTVGDALPAFTTSYSGFVAGDGPGALGGSLTFSTLATSSSAPGSYAVTPGGYSSGNYVITYVSGTLTVFASRATNSTSDLITLGDWTFQYGGEGYYLMQGPSQQPTFGSIAPAGDPWPWTISATGGGVNALELPDGSGRLEAYDYSYSSLSYDLDLGSSTHQLALYFADYEGVHRSEQVDLIDQATGAIMVSDTITDFSGRYLVYHVSGAITLRISVVSGVNAVISGIFLGGPLQGLTNGQATFVATDTTTSGDWKYSYGADGYGLLGATLAYPSYAHPLVRGDDHMWASSTTEPRALQDGSGRVASCFEGYPSLDVAFNITGSARRVALYFLDWERVNRAETVDIVDALTGAVLDSRSISDFGDGVYLVYDLQGYVRIHVTATAGPNAVMSGVFFGAAAAVPGSGTATFVTTDAATQGDWTMRYGADGYDLFGSTAAYPSYATTSTVGCWPSVWQASSSDVRALEKVGGGREAGSLEGYAPYLIDLTMTGGAHRVALYCLDWEKVNRVETVEILDGQTGAVLDTRSVSSFGNGVYLVYDITGHVKFRITPTGGPNAEVSGLFFGAARIAPQPGAAVYLGSDSTTQGNWTALYGFDGHSIPTLTPAYPAYAAKVSERGDVMTWAPSTTDVRATEIPGDRIAADWSSPTSFSQFLDLGATPNNVAFYFLDWENVGRTQTVEIIDATTGTVLDTHPLSAFGGGVYLVYSLSGFVEVRVTNTGTANAVMSGVFYGAIAPAGG